MKDADDPQIEEILRFWFDETSPKQKFSKDAEFDALVRRRFEADYRAVMQDETAAWRETPRGRLAEILVLDQFSRNMFRGDPQSFAGDELALERARAAVAAGADQELPLAWRAFVYMPFMHSESPEVQAESLDLFTAYGNDTYLKYAGMHKDIIDRFGRFPHRNGVLGRRSSLEEQDYLEEHGGF